MIRKIIIYDINNKVQHEELEFDTNDYRVIIKDDNDRIVYYSNYETIGEKYEETGTTIQTD